MRERRDVSLNWREAPLDSCGFVLRGQGGTRSDDDRNGVPCIRYGDIYTSHDVVLRQFASFISPYAAPRYTRLEPGDTVFAGSGETFDEIGKATTYCGSDEAYAGGDTIIFRPDRRQVDPRFAAYAVNGPSATSYKSRMGQGSSVIHIASDHIRHLRLQLPPLAAQTRIADVLVTVDEAIHQTRALIAKTQQIKAGLMHDLFTRGVLSDGNQRPRRDEARDCYRESRVGWIPADWQCARLGDLSEIVSGVTLGAKPPAGGVEVPYLRVANVQDGYLDLADVKTIRVGRDKAARLALRYGDVLMNEGGDFDKLGRGTLWKCEIDSCIHQNHVFRVRPRSDALLPEYLAYWSQSEAGRSYFLISSKQSTNLASINSSQLHRCPIGLPPQREQALIAERLLAVDRELETLRDEVSKYTALKRGLMHDLLTGTVRVPVGSEEAATAGV